MSDKPKGATPESANRALNSLGIDWLSINLGKQPIPVDREIAEADNTDEADGHLADTESSDSA